MRWMVALVAVAGCLESAPSPADLAATSDLSAGPDLVIQDMTMRRAVVYVSGYSPQIARFALDGETGALTSLGTTPVTGNPSFLAFAPSGKFLYALDEAPTGRVRAFSVGADGALTALGGAVSSEGNGPAHLSVD